MPAVQAVIEPPPPPEPEPKEFGKAVWVKEIRTTSHNNREIQLRNLISDDQNWRNGEPDEVADKVVGLDAGADDYLVKPYSMEELLARLRAAERRSKPERTPHLRVADLEIDLHTRTARRGGARIVLTNRESALLETLAQALPRSVSKAMLVDKVWDQYFDPGSNVVNVYVNYLRKKVDLPGLKPLIHTLRGVGFALREEAGEDSLP